MVSVCHISMSGACRTIRDTSERYKGSPIALKAHGFRGQLAGTAFFRALGGWVDLEPRVECTRARKKNATPDPAWVEWRSVKPHADSLNTPLPWALGSLRICGACLWCVGWCFTVHYSHVAWGTLLFSLRVFEWPACLLQRVT